MPQQIDTPEKRYTYDEILAYIQTLVTKELWNLEQNRRNAREGAEKKLAFIRKQVDASHFRLDGHSTEQLIIRLYNDMERFSILTEPLENDEVEGIQINSWQDVRVKYLDGHMEHINGFNSPVHAKTIIQRLLQESGCTIDNAHPLGESSLQNTIRIAAIQTPVVDESVGVAGYIRKLREQVFTESEYHQQSFATPQILQDVQNYVGHGISCLIIGKKNTGKTTYGKYILDNLPDWMRITTIETGAREMDLHQSGNNVTHLLARESAMEDQNVTQEKLVSFSLILDADVIAVLEMRGREADAAVEAGLSSHIIVSTVHAGSVDMGHRRIADLLQKCYPIDHASALLKACEAFPLGVFIHQTYDGVRRIMSVVECVVDTDDTIRYNPLWEYHVKENRRTASGAWETVGEYVRKGIPSPAMVERMKLYGLSDAELADLKGDVV